MRVIYRKIRHARYLYIKWNVEKVWGARYTLGARYLSKNTVNQNIIFVLPQKENCAFTDQNLAFLRTGLYLYIHPRTDA